MVVEVEAVVSALTSRSSTSDTREGGARRAMVVTVRRTGGTDEDHLWDCCPPEGRVNGWVLGKGRRRGSLFRPRWGGEKEAGVYSRLPTQPPTHATAPHPTPPQPHLTPPTHQPTLTLNASISRLILRHVSFRLQCSRYSSLAFARRLDSTHREKGKGLDSSPAGISGDSPGLTLSL